MKRVLLAFFIFIAVSLLFFYPIFKGKIPFPGDLLVGNYSPYDSNSYQGYGPGAVPNKAQGPDVIRQLFPWKNFVVESFKSLEFPLWNPYSLSGNPLIANFQSGSFYPLNLIFLLSSFINAWTIFIILTPFLACFFTYLFLRELGLKISSSIFAGIVFAYSSYMVVWMEYGNVGHTFLWLPLILLILEKFIKKQKLIYIIYLAVFLSIAFLAGYVQGYFYILLVAIFYFFSRSFLLKKISRRSTTLFVIGLVSPIILCAFQLLPTIELFKYSSRSGYSIDQIDKLLNPIWYLITMIIPNFFGHPAARNSWFYGTYIERVSYFGFIPFVLAIYALFNIKKRKETMIFGGLFVLSLLLATNLFFNKFIYLIPLPFISTTVPTRILAIFVFCGSVLSGFGLEFFLEKINKKAISSIALFIVCLNLFLWILVFVGPVILPSSVFVSNILIIKRNLVFPTIFSGLFLVLTYINFGLKNVRSIILTSLFVITFLDLFYFFHKITPFSPKEYVYPQTEVLQYLRDNGSINRFWGYGGASIDNNFSTYEKIYSTSGYEPLHIKRYGELISASKDGKIASQVSGSDANIEAGYGAVSLMDNKYRKRLFDLLGVKYILNKSKLLGSSYFPDYSIFTKENFKLVWQKSPWQVYENVGALPRVFLASDYVVKNNKEKILQMIFDDKFNLKDKLILEEPVSINLSKDNDAKVEIKEYSANKIVIRTKAKTNTLLFISDNYYPGWHVSIDNKFGKIYRADYSFRAVAIPKGNHEVIFSYYPESFDLGIKISLITFSLTILFVIIQKLKKR